MEKKETKNNQDNIVIDATGQTAGRLASQVAMILMGKNKANYQPNKAAKVKVRVENIARMKFSGKKLEQKEYVRHSGYPGGLKRTKMGKVFKEKPAQVLAKAIFSMLPKNRLRKQRLKNLEIK